MKYNKLGTTGIEVSQLALGGLFTSSLGGGVEESRRLLEVARHHGINYIDTAPAYADSEYILGRALMGMQEDFIISSKFGGRPLPFNPQAREQLVFSFQETLKQLGRQHIDVLLIHEPDRPQQYPWWTNYTPLAGPVLDYLHELANSGVIRAKGLAGTTTTEMSYLVSQGQFEVVLTAFNYNVLFREAGVDLIPEAHRRQMGIIAGSMIGQGFLARRFDRELEQPVPWLSHCRRDQFLQFYKLADEWGINLPELCLRWGLADQRLSTILEGAKTEKQLLESIQAYEKGPLPPTLMEQLHQVANLLPYRPYEEPMILPFGKSYHGPGLTNLGAGLKIGAPTLTSG